MSALLSAQAAGLLHQKVQAQLRAGGQQRLRGLHLPAAAHHGPGDRQVQRPRLGPGARCGGGIVVNIFLTDTKIFSVTGLNCENCPDECEATEYSAQISYAEFRDPGNFFYKNLLRKSTSAKPVINKALFKEYETYVKSFYGNVDIFGPPTENKDPRPLHGANSQEQDLQDVLRPRLLQEFRDDEVCSHCRVRLAGSCRLLRGDLRPLPGLQPAERRGAALLVHTQALH